MIQEDYVSLETAKLLKDKGFNWEVHRSYLVNDNCFAPADVNDLPYRKDAIRIPTLQMVTKWLQVTFNVIIIPNYEYECDDTPWCYKIFRLGENGKPERVDIKGVSYDKNNNPTEHIVGYRDYELSYKNYSTKEEAIEEGIKYCLENLI